MYILVEARIHMKRNLTIILGLFCAGAREKMRDDYPSLSIYSKCKIMKLISYHIIIPRLMGKMDVICLDRRRYLHVVCQVAFEGVAARYQAWNVSQRHISKKYFRLIMLGTVSRCLK